MVSPNLQARLKPTSSRKPSMIVLSWDHPFFSLITSFPQRQSGKGA